MENLWKFCLRASSGVLFILLLLMVLWTSCQRSDYEYYSKSFTPEENATLAQHLTDGITNYYQGSPASQLLLEEALRYDPNHALAHREIGVPYLKRGITAAFPHYYGRAADLDPLGWIGWRGYLYLYFYRDYERALQDFNALDTITPGVVDYPQSTSVDFMRGICYLQLDQYDEAIDYLDRHIAHEDSVAGANYVPPEAYLMRGIAQWKKGDTDEAMSSFRTGIALEDYNADLQYWLAKMYVERGDSAKARKWLKTAQLAFNKDDYNTRFYVEEFYQLYQEDLDALAAQL
ncbi:MAG: tetratricopeptide repeat protein [Bacteroidota bacterium]